MKMKKEIVASFHNFFLQKSTKLLCSYYHLLEDTAHYAGLLLAPAEGSGLWARDFLPKGKKIIINFDKGV